MSPEMRVRISAQNDTARGFAEVKRDAVAAANAVEQSGRRAASGMTMLGESSRMAAMQQRNLVFQLNDVAVSLASGMNPMMVFAQQGSQIATIYGPEEGGLGRAFSETGKMATSLVTKLWPIGIAAAAVGVAVAGVTNEINKTAKTSVSMGDVLRGAFQLLGQSIMGELAPAFEWLGGIWDQITPYMKDGVNFLIGSFVKGYDDIKTYWSMLPAAMGDFAISAANNVMKATEQMINGSLGQINAFVLTAKAALGPVLGAALQPVMPVDFGKGLDNPFAGAGGDLHAQLAQNGINAFTTNWVGEIGKRAEAISLLGESTDKGTKSLRDMADSGFGKLIEKTDQFAEATRSAFSNMGTGLIEAFSKGGNVALNVLDMVMGKVGQLGESLLNNGLNGLLDMGIKALFGGLGGGAWNIPTSFVPGGFFPAFAGGTSSAPGGMAWVGEKGPELVNLPRGAQVIPNHALKGSGGGRSLIVNIDARGAQMGVAEQLDQWARFKLPALVRHHSGTSMAENG